jgi:hypothetical protein
MPGVKDISIHDSRFVCLWRIHHLGNVGERDRREPGSFYALFGLGRAGVGRLFPSEAQEILGRVERAVRRAARAAASAPRFAMLLPDYIGTLVPAAVVMKPLDWVPCRGQAS